MKRIMEKQQEELTYGFYSNVLKKPFNTLEELKAEEKAYYEVEAKKEQEALTRKQDAKQVNDAFCALNAEKKAYNKAILDARKTYNSDLYEAKTKYNETVNKAVSALDAAQKIYDEALADFIKKNPNGYHLTLKGGDNVTAIRSEMNQASNDISFKTVNDLLDFWFNSIFK